MSTRYSLRRKWSGLTTGFVPDLLAELDVHRRLRGPYTGAGTLVRSILPNALAWWPDLVSRHSAELLSVAPEMAHCLPPGEQTCRASRIAAGVTEFVAEVLKRDGEVSRLLVVRHLPDADPTDAAWLGLMHERLAPQLLEIEEVTGRSPDGATDLSDAAGLAAAYVRSECLAEGSSVEFAYRSLPHDEREALHDQRADELEADDQISLRLGAIPFHRERGTDPGGIGVETLLFAFDYALNRAFRDAAADFGRRALRLLDAGGRIDEAGPVAAALAAVGVRS